MRWGVRMGGHMPKSSWRDLSHRDELLRAFRIGPEDILANRRGVLGPGQLRRLRHNIWWNLLAVGILEAAAVTVLLVLLVAAPNRRSWGAYVGFCPIIAA